jgi:ParB-like chromosome segregation protein Spo0J
MAVGPDSLDGVRHIEGDLYEVDVSLIQPADDTDANFCNPRHYFEDGEEVGDAFEDEEMEELFNDVKERGIRFPLECRWEKDEDDEHFIQLVDGERRLRCAERLELKTVLCHIHEEMSDEEAEKVAWRSTETARNFSENAQAHWVRRKRAQNYTDKQILNITGRSGQWLFQMDKLGGLDDVCFHAYCEGKIGLRVALDLADMENEEERIALCEETIKEGIRVFEFQGEKLKKAEDRAEDKVETAQATATAARLLGDKEAEDEAEQDLADAEEHLEEAKAATEAHDKSKPQGKTKQLRQAAKKLGVDGKVSQFVGKVKIKKCLDKIEAAIKNDGVDPDSDEEELLGEIEDLRLVRKVIQAFLAGEHDIVKILKSFYTAERRRK